MRLGGPIFQKHNSPEEWVAAVRAEGYRAAFCPLGPDADGGRIEAYAQAAAAADIVIAEVGAWSNPLSPDKETRDAAVEKCTNALRLADAVGARCCVNIAGSRGEKWDGPCAEDLTDATFDTIVDTVREIVDAVQPHRTYYTLETMPWMYPDSADSYRALIQAIARDAVAVHFDPVNLISSPQRYFRNADIIREFVAKLGPRIRSCHAKDTLLQGKLTVHLDEVRPGRGALDYSAYFAAISQLDDDIPVMLEHLSGADEYRAAAAHLRRVAAAAGIEL